MAIGGACSFDVGTGIGVVVDNGVLVFTFLLMLGDGGLRSVVGCNTGDGDCIKKELSMSSWRKQQQQQHLPWIELFWTWQHPSWGTLLQAGQIA